jgi:hypothetical protein
MMATAKNRGGLTGLSDPSFLARPCPAPSLSLLLRLEVSGATLKEDTTGEHHILSPYLDQTNSMTDLYEKTRNHNGKH